MENTNERAVCDEHGLVYNPAKQDGCVLCREAKNKRTPIYKHAAAVFITVAVIGAGAAIHHGNKNNVETSVQDVSATSDENNSVEETVDNTPPNPSAAEKNSELQIELFMGSRSKSRKSRKREIKKKQPNNDHWYKYAKQNKDIENRRRDRASRNSRRRYIEEHNRRTERNRKIQSGEYRYFPGKRKSKSKRRRRRRR